MVETDYLSEDGSVVEVRLTSCSVFWKELGYVESDRARTRAAILFDSEIEPWLKANCKSSFNPYDKGVWFSSQQDAALFKIMFHGKFDD